MTSDASCFVRLVEGIPQQERVFPAPEERESGLELVADLARGSTNPLAVLRPQLLDPELTQVIW